MKIRAVPIDYFGVAGSPLLQTLLDQSSNKRARRLAFNNLFRLAKASALVAKADLPRFICFTVNLGGEQEIQFHSTSKDLAL